MMLLDALKQTDALISSTTDVEVVKILLKHREDIIKLMAPAPIGLLPQPRLDTWLTDDRCITPGGHDYPMMQLSNMPPHCKKCGKQLLARTNQA